jgi:archaellum component FlaC
MKKEELRELIVEHLVLRKRMDSLREELRKIENRYEEVGRFLYWFRSKEFHHSVLWCLEELREEYAEDQHFDDLVHSVVHSLKDENIDERKRYTPKNLFYLYDEKVE